MKKPANLRDLRERTDDDLKGQLARLEEELFGARMKRFTNQLENTMQIRNTRREIARLKTILSARTAGTEKQKDQQQAASDTAPAQQET